MNSLGLNHRPSLLGDHSPFHFRLGKVNRGGLSKVLGNRYPGASIDHFLQAYGVQSLGLQWNLRG